MKKLLIKWSAIIFVIIVLGRGCQEAAMYTFVNGYYVGCNDSVEKDTKEGFRDFKRVSEIEEWCRARMKHIWDQRHN